MQNIKQVAEFIRRHKYWLVALSSLPFFGMVAAFGTAPDTRTTDIVREITVEPLDLPQLEVADSAAFDFWREDRVQRGDTLSSILSRMGVSGEEIQRVLASLSGSNSLGKLISGRSILVRVTAKGRLLLFRYLASDHKLTTIERSQEQFHIVEQDVQLEPILMMRSGKITHSLFGATDEANVPDSIASEMAEVFSGEVDFHRDLRQGDQFSVVYEAFMHEGRLVKTGRLMAAEFINNGNTLQAIHFVDAKGNAGYFAPDGKSLKRAFLKSPLPFTRITSGFTMSRYHPVLKEWRSHKGVDYGAPSGTPIRAVSDATVSFVGRKGGYGNLVVLNHQKPYSTAYGHMSRFAKGLHRGSKVRQGEVIGYVGKTGLATGPHLHYEFRVNNVQKNPLAMKLPRAFPLDKRLKAQFTASTTPLMRQLDLIRGHNVSARD